MYRGRAYNLRSNSHSEAGSAFALVSLGTGGGAAAIGLLSKKSLLETAASEPYFMPILGVIAVLSAVAAVYQYKKMNEYSALYKKAAADRSPD